MVGLPDSSRAGSSLRAARLAAVAGALAIASIWGSPGPAAAVRDAASGPAPLGRTVQRIAPGLTLTRISQNSGPEQIRVLTVDPSQSPTIDVGLPGGELGHYERTSQQAKHAGALAAVNGDFALWPGRPAHALLRDGRFVASEIHRGSMIAESDAETKGFAAAPRIQLSATVHPGDHRFRIAQWNTASPRGDRIAGFTPQGGRLAEPPTNTCSVRLLARGDLRWGPGKVGLRRDYRVHVKRCGHKATSLAGGVVLSSRQHGTGAHELRALSPGDSLTLGWSLGWADVLDAIGGTPQLVRNGNNVVPNHCTASLCYRQPRTAVGITAGGRMLLVTVDGRRGNWSIGLTLDALAKEMKSLGAVDAVNLDGGGGTTMWVRGRGLVNRPSDAGGERPVNTTLLVLPGRDRGEPNPKTPERLARSPRSLAAARLAERDPGSTGGLLDALASGQLRP